ncbi:MAG: MMPL family transporter [Chthoniobacterales bacterium]
MIQLSNLVAQLVVRRPWALIAAALLIVGTCTWILFSRQSFDTDILNLLPADRSAVKGLKIANERFTQARELTFVIKGADPDSVEDFQAFFADALRKQPWVVRLLDGPPMETAQGRADLGKLLVPLLRNLPPDQFQSALNLLDPAAIRDRISRLRHQLDAGSPAARLELENDPLGLLAAAAKPLWQSSALNDSFDIVSPDGKMRLLPVVTNQPTLDADDCAALMKTVHAFMEKTRRDYGANAPGLEVTGRSAYVEEIASSMQRDIILTSLVSLLTVTALFWFSFRRLLPLLGVALLLAGSAFVSLALGSLIFHQLNVVAIGFCSILFGLGDDFGLLLYENYRHNRHGGAAHEPAIAAAICSMLPGIAWVTLTTAIGFLALTLSGSAGFAQLGAMVAIGVAVCAACVTAFLFLFVRNHAHDASQPRSVAFRGDTTLRIALPVFIALAVFALLPVRALHFDTSPHSLEPRDTPAAKALSDLMAGLPDSFEPSLVILETRDPAVTAKLDTHLQTLVKRGLLDEFASPTPLLLSPENARTNHADTAGAAAAFRDALVTNGFNPDAFRSTFESVKALSTPASASDWSKVLPAASPWWFVIDRMIAPDNSAVTAYLKPSAAYRNAASAPVLEKAVLESGLPVFVTGWTQTLGTLVPWAKQELLVFGSGVAGVILLVLAFVYRDWRDWLAHTLGLALAIGATVATLKLTGARINLLNVLAFPLTLAVGVDYGMHLVLAVRDGHIATVLKPVLISGLTTVTGFASLMLAKNPSLSGLGTVCALGVGWSLVAALTIVLPLTATLHRLRDNASRDKVTT